MFDEAGGEIDAGCGRRRRGQGLRRDGSMSNAFGQFPQLRLRRLRSSPILRSLVRETELNVRDFILPLFVRPGKKVRQQISSMPGNFQLSPDTLVEEVEEALALGVSSFILFGIPAS